MFVKASLLYVIFLASGMPFDAGTGTDVGKLNCCFFGQENPCFRQGYA